MAEKLARSRLRIRVKSFCATSSGPLCPSPPLLFPLPPPPPPRSYRFSDRVAAKPTSTCTLLLLSLCLSLFRFDGVHPRVHCYSGDRVRASLLYFVRRYAPCNRITDATCNGNNFKTYNRNFFLSFAVFIHYGVLLWRRVSF